MAADQPRTRRAVKWVALGAVVLVAALIVVGVGVIRDDRGVPNTEMASAQSDSGGGGASDGGGSENPTDPSPEPSAENDPTDPPRDIGIDPQKSRPTESPAVAPAPSDGSGVELEPVAPEAVVEAPAGAVVHLARIEAVQGQAVAGGEISGPAIRVSVTIRNDGTEPIDLEYVVVNAYSGSGRTPAGTLMQPGGEPFVGSLSADESAEGVYLFSIAESDRKDVVITVDYGVGEPIVVFRGDLT